MKPFSLAAGMTNMRGVFYPTGHMVLMFPTQEDARHACELLRQDGVSEDDLIRSALRRTPPGSSASSPTRDTMP